MQTFIETLSRRLNFNLSHTTFGFDLVTVEALAEPSPSLSETTSSQSDQRPAITAKSNSWAVVSHANTWGIKDATLLRLFQSYRYC